LLNGMVGTPARLTLSLLTLMVAAAPLGAQQEPPAQPQQREHLVRRGDTLWDLARLYLNNPFLWPMIFEANRDVVRDPHWIYPAERLIIPGLLQQQPFQQPEPIGRPPLPRPEGLPELPAAQDTAPTMLTTLDLRRPVLSAGEYVRLPWLSPTADPGITGRILRRNDASGVPERIPSALYPNDRVQLSEMPVMVGDSLVVIRPGRRIGTHGTVIEPVALLRVDSVAQGAVLARIATQFGSARVGDVVMPLYAVPELPIGDAEAVEYGVEGRILEFLAPAPMQGTTDLAFISLGRADGVRIGDEFAVYVSAGGGIMTQSGTLRVVRVGERTATARVISVTGTTMRDGLPIRLVRRMP
jgi:hypothetical protein